MGQSADRRIVTLRGRAANRESRAALLVPRSARLIQRIVLVSLDPRCGQVPILALLEGAKCFRSEALPRWNCILAFAWSPVDDRTQLTVPVARAGAREDNIDKRFDALRALLRKHQTVAVAFSGGADSTLLLAEARDALGADHVAALTAVTPYMVRQEIGDAVGIAAELGMRHELVEMDMPEGMETNPRDRCYRCKRSMYGLLLQRAEEMGFRTLLDACNTDDADIGRPGLIATRELDIGSPFIACGIDKDAIRAQAKLLGLPTWRKPNNACLLTRIRFDERVSMDRLQQIEEAERFLSARDYTWVRVRSHGDLARIEVAREQRQRLLDEADLIGDGIRAFGFNYVALDLVGYQLGSMNEPRH